MTVTPRVLRPYQSEAVDAVHSAWKSSMLRPAVVLPTGSGKSSVIAKLAVEARGRRQRVAMLAHRGELLQQMADSVRSVDPYGHKVGIVQGTRRETSAEIVSASFQSLGTVKALRDLGRRDIILCDEAHHLPAKTYRRVLERLGSFDEDSGVLTAGFTATMSRGKDGGLGEIWDDVVYEKDIVWAIERGYLIPPRGLTVQLPDLDLSKVRLNRGDFQRAQLETAVAASVESTVEAARQHLVGRAAIVFAVGVEHADMLADRLTEVGLRARAVTGSMSRDQREEVYDAFRGGDLECMVTVQVLTEGADFPRCDAVLMARPTRSQVLYTQMVGRALRPYPGKVDALVVDLTGVARGHSLVTLTDLVSEAKVVGRNLDGEEIDLDALEDDEPMSRMPAAERLGVIELAELDLLTAGRHEANWLQSSTGVWFLHTRPTVLFLWPDQDGYRVGHKTSEGPNKGQGFLFGGFVGPLRDAMEAAEIAMSDQFGLAPPPRDAPWRRVAQPSQAQIDFAKRMGVRDAERMTRGRISDEIDRAYVDRLLPR